MSAFSDLRVVAPTAYTQGKLPARHRTEFGYTNGLPIAISNANGHGFANEFDSSGYLSHTIPALGPDVTFTRDNLGRVVATTVPGESASRTSSQTLDTLGRVTSATRPDGLSETFAYDILGNLTNSVDVAGRTTALTWLPAGHLESTTRWLDTTPVTISNSYDRQFNSLKITDPLGRVVETYKLDMQDRPLLVTNIDRRVMSFNYGVGGRVRSVTRFDGTVVSNLFDSAGRVAQAQYPGMANVFTYFADGSLATATNAAGRVANTYDALNRLSFTTGAAPRSAVSYGLYPAGQVSNVVSVAGTNSYLLDAADRLTSITTPTGTFVLAYNSWNGLVAGVTNQNAKLGVFYSYDQLDRVTNIVWKNSTGNVLRSFGYVYDNAGNITNIAREAGSYSRGFSYDALDRLIGENTNGVIVSTLYDLAGNRTNRGGVRCAYVFTNGVQTDRLASFGTGTTNKFDAAGNVTNTIRNGVNLALKWNNAYQLTEVRTNNISALRCGFDALSRRAWTWEGGTTNWHVYAGPHVIA